MEISGLIITVLLATFIITGSIMIFSTDTTFQDEVFDTTKIDEVNAKTETYTEQISGIGESVSSTAVGFLGLGALIKTLIVDTLDVARDVIVQLSGWIGLPVGFTTVLISCLVMFVAYQAYLLYRGVKG